MSSLCKNFGDMYPRLPYKLGPWYSYSGRSLKVVKSETIISSH